MLKICQRKYKFVKFAQTPADARYPKFGICYFLAALAALAIQFVFHEDKHKTGFIT